MNKVYDISQFRNLFSINYIENDKLSDEVGVKYST